MVAEFRQQIPAARLSVQNYFRDRFSATIDASFWTKQFGTECPLERLRETALDAAVTAKVEQLLMQDERILIDVSYKAFLQSLKEANDERAEGSRISAPVYGPQTLSADNYFQYLQSTRVIALKQQIRGVSGSDAELKKEYDSLEPSVLSKGHIVQVEEVRAVYAASGAIKKAEAKRLVSAVRESAMRDNTSLHSEGDFSRNRGLKYDTTTFRSSSRRGTLGNIVEAELSVCLSMLQVRSSTLAVNSWFCIV